MASASPAPRKSAKGEEEEEALNPELFRSPGLDGSSTARHHHEHPHQKLKLPLSSLPLFYESALFLFPNVGKGWIFQKSSPNHATAHFCRHQKPTRRVRNRGAGCQFGVWRGQWGASDGKPGQSSSPRPLAPSAPGTPLPTLLDGTLPCRERRHDPQACCAGGLAPPRPWEASQQVVAPLPRRRLRPPTRP